MLLLDEPTNDLDFDGLARLERFVAERPGGAVIVSHDRAFLERTVTRVLEIDEIAHTATEYGGGWAGYLELRATAARHAQERFDEFATKRSGLEERANRQRNWVETGRAQRPAQGARQRQGAQGPPRRPHGEAGREGAHHGARDRAPRGGRQAVEAMGAAAALRRRGAGGARSSPVSTARSVRRGSFSLGPIDLEIAWGERIALTGPNGAGKTTLVEALLGRLELTAGASAGSVPASASVSSPGPWRAHGEADPARGVRRGHGAERPGGAVPARQVRASATTPWAPAQSLSPGERTRAELARLMATGVNWLVLDEPTNHLDLPAIEQLETALDAFDGTLLLVSHDRRLLDAVRIDRRVAVG
jgi:ATPase subunit of ABC transporter with duplicated ATPase domains